MKLREDGGSSEARGASDSRRSRASSASIVSGVSSSSRDSSNSRETRTSRKSSDEPHDPWPMVRLGDVCDEIKDRIQSSKISVDEYVTTDNMVKDRGGIVPAEYVPSDVGLVEYHKDDVLIANIRPYLKKIWLADHDGGCSSDVVVFRSKTDGLSSEYLYSVLSQDAYFEYVMQKPRGTKMPRGDRDWMKEFRFPLPPLSVQREIVARLERELAAVEKMKKVSEALAETARADYVAECRVIFERIAQEHPKVSLDDACEFIKDGTHQTPTYTDDIYRGYKFLSSKDVVTGEIDWSKIRYIPKSLHDELYLHVAPQRGDILLAKNGTTGIGALVETDEVFDIYVSLALLRFKAGNNPRYLWYAVNSPQAREQYNAGLRGSGVPNLHLTEIRKVHICLPSVQIQDKVVSELDAIKARAEKLEAKAREGVAVCETMRKAILKEAFE